MKFMKAATIAQSVASLHELSWRSYGQYCASNGIFDHGPLTVCISGYSGQACGHALFVVVSRREYVLLLSIPGQAIYHYILLDISLA